MRYLLALIAVCLSACSASRPIKTESYALGCSTKVPFKGEKGGCFLYSEQIMPKLKESGAKDIHRLTYKWMDFGNQRGYHTVVAYTDSIGQNWIVDNERPWPKRIPGETMQERCEWFAKNFGEGPSILLIADNKYP